MRARLLPHSIPCPLPLAPIPRRNCHTPGLAFFVLNQTISFICKSPLWADFIRSITALQNKYSFKISSYKIYHTIQLIIVLVTSIKLDTTIVNLNSFYFIKKTPTYLNLIIKNPKNNVLKIPINYINLIIDVHIQSQMFK